eukprot:10200363-Lingulodinium_polyedra.AAC.1
MGTPCGSFSKARNQPGGPPPLRDAAAPAGKAGLRPSDALKVLTGNTLAAFSAAVFREAVAKQIPVSIENPES